MAKVVSIREYTDIDEEGNFRKMYEVSYEIEGVGRFTLEIPKEEFSSLVVQQMIRQHEAEIRKLMSGV